MAGEAVHFDGLVALSELAVGAVRLVLPSPLGPSPVGLRLEASSSPGAPFVLLTSASLERELGRVGAVPEP